MKYILIFLMIPIAVICAAQSAPAVNNVNVSQRTDGSKLIDIYYNLADLDNDLCSVYVRVSVNDGQSYDLIPTIGFLSGDVGENIAPGIGKHIIWDATAEGFRLDGDNYRFKVTAEDNSSPPYPSSFIFVPGGTFAWDASNVTISSFWVDKYEVTQGDYQFIMKKNPSSGYGVGVYFPVYRVSWFNCVEYCNKRSLFEGLEPAYTFYGYGTNPENWPQGWDSDFLNHTQFSCNWSANGYRLLSNMEWRFVAKGGIYSQNFIYAGSNDLSLVAWHAGNSGNTSHMVGMKPPNELGVHDMTGNVWEWVWDIWDTSWTPGNTTDPHGPSNGNYRVTCGGAYSTAVQFCPIAYYNCGGYADSIYWSAGFRVCRNADYEPFKGAR
jgi:hypothetical protein